MSQDKKYVWQILRFNELESRDSTLENFYEPLLAKYVVKSEPFLCVREVGENGNNLHYHIAFASSAKTQCIRTWINRSAWKGNKNYSLKVGSEDLLERQFDYLCKGKSRDDLPEILSASADFDDTVVAKRHETYWIEHDKLMATGRKRKANTGTAIGDQVYAICKQKADTLGVIPSEDQVIEITMRWYIAHKTSMSVFHVTNVVNWVIGKLHTQDTVNDLGHDLFDANRMEIFKQNCKLKLSGY